MNISQEVARWIPFGGVALLLPFWQQLKMLASRARSYLIQKTTIDRGVKNAVISYLGRTAKTSQVGDKWYSGHSIYVKPLRKNQLVGWEVPANKLYWLGWFPVILTTDTSKEKECTSLITIRGFDVKALIERSINAFNEIAVDNSESRFSVRRITGRDRHEGWDRKGAEAIDRVREEDPFMDFRLTPLIWKREDVAGASEDRGAFSGLSFSEEVKEAIKEFDYWLASRTWFEDRGVPWRRGWLVYGPPGTGKSRLAAALGQHGNMPIYSYDLATLTNAELQQHWSNMLANTPCMALFEDFDAVFHGRENVTKKVDALTFDCLLNTISGVSQSNGVFLLITTNRLECIDEAIGIPKNGMSTRPGRIDRVVAVDVLPEDCRREIARHILDDWPEEVERVVRESDGYTGAQVTDLCIRLAEKKFWEKS